MTDHNSDEAKEFRRDRLTVIKPVAAPKMLSEREFREQYMGYYLVAREVMAEVEQHEHIMFCPACRDDSMNQVKVRRLHVSYERDHLGNYPMLATLKCNGCEWGEIIPVIVPELTDAERSLIRRADAVRNVAIQPAAYSRTSDGTSPQQMKRDYNEEMMRSLQADVTRVNSQLRFGQPLADSTWKSFDHANDQKRKANLAASQIEFIEQAEKELQAASQSRAAQKAATHNMAYGMSAAKMRDCYSQQIGAQMAKQYDADVLNQMQNTHVGENMLSKMREMFKLP
jgi:hypothetical protein